MKTVLVFIVLGIFSFSMAFKDSHSKGVWEDQNEIAWDEPESIVLNKKTHVCADVTGCGCPMLLCTGETSCKRYGENPIKCQLTKPYEDIDLQKAKIAFFGPGDCKCNPLKLKSEETID